MAARLVLYSVALFPDPTVVFLSPSIRDHITDIVVTITKILGVLMKQYKIPTGTTNFI